MKNEEVFLGKTLAEDYILGTLWGSLNIILMLILIYGVFKFYRKAMKCMDKYLKE
jgi:hypothetical protein